MKVAIQSVNFNMDKELKNYIETKIDTLEKFYDNFIEAQVFLKVQQTSEKENKITEINVKVPGDEIIVKRTTKTFEDGVSQGVDALKRGIKKLKEKQRGR